MLPDKVLTLSMTYDDQSADLVVVVTDSVTGTAQGKEWSTTSVAHHADNEWHTVRDLLIEFVAEAF